jgi:DNA-binding LacI/PurR family transcriptional regulator
MGNAAVELLVKEIAGVRVTHGELLFEPELVVRGSTGPAPSVTSGRRSLERSAKS